MSRIKKQVKADPVETRDEMENCVREICLLTIRRDELTAQMDDEIARIRDVYQADLAEIQVNLDAEMGRAHDWAENNPHEFAKKKSLAMVHGTVGYRTGMPRLKTLKGWTWDRVLEVLKAVAPEYIRTKQETDKDKIIAERSELDPENLRNIGVQIVQDETFFVEPNREEKEKEETK